MNIKPLVRTLILGGALGLLALPAAAIPQLQQDNGTTRLLVNGKPYLILGGELGNSSASSLDYMDDIWPKAKAMHLNTLLVPIYWELIEPEEGKFDFSLVEGLIKRARREDLKLVFLWFGSWKNSMSTYVPSWLKRDSQRFPHSRSAEGEPQEILTAFSRENLDADRRAFRALLQFIGNSDSRRETVLMVQVENEIGMLPSARDHHPLADAAFAQAVPDTLMTYLREHRATLQPELRDAWSSSNFRTDGNWRQVFGDSAAAEEIFTAWHYARYANAVAAAGKEAYPLPMYVNAALNRPGKKPGEYPSGGPLPHLLDIWKAATPSIDLLSPDFYNPRFTYWNDRYTGNGEALFIPEIRFDSDAAAKAFYAFGHYNALGFSPFSVETGQVPATDNLRRSYALLQQLEPQFAASDREHRAGVWLSKEKPQMSFNLGDYHFTARHVLTLGWSPDASAETWPQAGAVIVQTGPEDFIVAGTGVVLTFDTANGRAGIDTLSEGEFRNGEWQPHLYLNGDQSHQGRHLRIPSGEWQIQKLRLYRYH